MKTENVDNLVEQIEVQGKLTSIRSYTVGDHLEFRFPYTDPATGRRRFKCCRRLEDAKDAARQIGVTKPSTRAETQTAVVEAAVRRAVAEAFNKAAAATGPAVQTLPFNEVASRFLTDKETAMTRGELRYASYRDLLTRTEHLKKTLASISTVTAWANTDAI